MSARIAVTLSAHDRAAIVDGLRVLAYANLLYLRRAPRTVGVYASGVRFRPEPQQGSGVELYQTIPEVLAQGWGDCDDLAGWRCAELCAQGERADVDLVAVERGGIGPRLWHAVVRRESGAIEDVAELIGARERGARK